MIRGCSTGHGEPGFPCSGSPQVGAALQAPLSPLQPRTTWQRRGAPSSVPGCAAGSLP